MNQAQEIKPSDIIDYDTYESIIFDTFEQAMIDRGYDPNTRKLNGNNANALLRAVYKQVFKPSKTQINNQTSNITYNIDNIAILLDIYVDLCQQYNILPSIYGLCRLIGMDDQTLIKYDGQVLVSGERFSIGKILTDARQTSVLNELYTNNLGVTVLANNETTVNLCYNRQNMIEETAIKQGLSMQELPKLG